MKADKREIVTFVIAALATLVAVWFFLSKMQKEKETVRTDLYTLVAPASDAILSVNRPAAFTKYILSRNSERDAFASKVPDIYLSIIQNNRDLPWLLLSFHPQGVVFYAQAGNSLAGRIEKNTLQKSFGSFAPQKQKEQQDAINANRAGQVGTGDRSEKIRTYNFPQDRCTDHRIGLTVHNLEKIMDGNLDEVIDALATREQTEKLQRLGG